jgi:hypothetical protein
MPISPKTFAKSHDGGISRSTSCLTPKHHKDEPVGHNANSIHKKRPNYLVSKHGQHSHESKRTLEPHHRHHVTTTRPRAGPAADTTTPQPPPHPSTRDA